MLMSLWEDMDEEKDEESYQKAHICFMANSIENNEKAKFLRAVIFHQRRSCYILIRIHYPHCRSSSLQSDCLRIRSKLIFDSFRMDARSHYFDSESANGAESSVH
ncbi:hypothetical protein PIB30_056051, partial [Stylosanthes scabra]|nr:hypothetical protein [Stylosanthes scabra]